MNQSNSQAIRGNQFQNKLADTTKGSWQIASMNWVDRKKVHYRA